MSSGPGKSARERRKFFRNVCEQLQRLEEHGTDLRKPGKLLLEVEGKKFELSTLDTADMVRKALAEPGEPKKKRTSPRGKKKAGKRP